MTRHPLRAGVSLPLTGRHAAQGGQAGRGLELWRDCVDRGEGLVVSGTSRPLDLRIVDDGSSPRRALENVRALAAGGADLLFGPYGRAACAAVASFTTAEGRILWNHGSSADDSARPLVVSLPTPASRYLEGVIDVAVTRGCESVLIAANDAPFGRTVAAGGAASAAAAGVEVRRLSIPPGAWPAHHEAIIAAARRDVALVLCGRLDDDVEAVAALRAARANPRLLAAVGAGVQRFGDALGPDAGGVVGPSQWEPDDELVDLGPSSREVVTRHRERYGVDPDYVVVQAWASGVLAEAALAAAGLDPGAVWRWALGFSGRTAYGAFALTPDGRQVGHRMRVVEWGSDRRRRPIR